MGWQSRIAQIAAESGPLVDAAVKAGAELVAADAKSRVPVNTGKLRDAIHVESDHEGSYVVAGDNATFYGHIIEHGGVHTPPRPFLVPALEANRAAIVAAGAAALRQVT